MEGTFGDLQVDLEYPVSAEEYVLEKASSHQHVNIQQSDSSREFKLGNVHFSDGDLDYEELLEDAVKGKLGRMISDGSVRQNPNHMEIDEIFRCLYADVTGFSP
nr:MAG: hypothetical protein J07AB56_14160 [Candidatus Nanosalinarum sp. J07AB56]